MVNPVEDPKVYSWLQLYPSQSTRKSCKSSFKHFEQFTGKTRTEMLAEARECVKDPDKADIYGALIMQYHQRLLNSKAQLRDSV